MSSEWTQLGGSSCFIVENSDPEEDDDFSQINKNPAHLLKGLPALNPRIVEVIC